MFPKLIAFNLSIALILLTTPIHNPLEIFLSAHSFHLCHSFSLFKTVYSSWAGNNWSFSRFFFFFEFPSFLTLIPTVVYAYGSEWPQLLRNSKFLCQAESSRSIRELAPPLAWPTQRQCSSLTWSSYLFDVLCSQNRALLHIISLVSDLNFMTFYYS